MNTFVKESIAIGFPGQGPPGIEAEMALLIREHPISIEVFKAAEDILNEPVLSKILSETSKDTTSREKQIRLYLGSAALWKTANHEGIIPQDQRRIFFGASAGEYAALMASGAYDFETGLKLINTRGEEMHQASIVNPGEMLAASGLSFEDAKEIVKNFPGVYAVNDNPGNQTVFSGAAAGLKALGDYLTASSTWSSVRLYRPDILEAAHSWHMSPAVSGLKKALTNSKIKKPAYDFMGNQAKLVKSTKAIKNHLAGQLTRGVLLRESAIAMKEQYGVTTFIDVGPGKVLYGQMKRQFRREAEMLSIVDILLPEKE